MQVLLGEQLSQKVCAERAPWGPGNLAVGWNVEISKTRLASSGFSPRPPSPGTQGPAGRLGTVRTLWQSHVSAKPALAPTEGLGAGKEGGQEPLFHQQEAGSSSPAVALPPPPHPSPSGPPGSSAVQSHPCCPSHLHLRHPQESRGGRTANSSPTVLGFQSAGPPGNHGEVRFTGGAGFPPKAPLHLEIYQSLYFGPCVMRTHVLDPNFQGKKSFVFNF